MHAPTNNRPAGLGSHGADLLRLATAGSVDDGKSTLIGRLLHDSQQIFVDQLEAVERTSIERGDGYVNLALLTDGLRAEREQGITIDVAYRYFATARRRFIIADTPGHVSYTRNMVTGASTADLALILVDARNGLTQQSRRHAFIASLLRIPHVVVCVNKMDLVDFSADVFEAIKDEFSDFSAKLEVSDVSFLPVSALHGDNVVERSERTPWYDGTSLLTHLENVHIASDRNLIDARFPVQWVIRPMSDDHHDYRGYAGQIAAGIFRAGDDVMVLPSGATSRIRSLDTYDGPLEEAVAGDSVTMLLEDDLDVSRGDLVCRPHNQPQVGRDVEAIVCWMSERPARPGARYAIKHLTRSARAELRELRFRIDVDTLHRDEHATQLGLNEIGRVVLRSTAPLTYDAFRRSRLMGSLILVDEDTNDTVGAAMVIGPAVAETAERSPDVTWHPHGVSRERRWREAGQRGATIWFTGLPSSGKSTIAAALEERLLAAGRAAYMIDGDNLRHGLNADLGFDAAARGENVRRAAEVARLFADAGTVALVSLVSPYAADRERARALHEADGLPFVEVFVDTPLEECERRDPKGLYARARAGEITGFTGIDDPYEPPASPDVRIGASDQPLADAVELLLARLEELEGEADSA
jgi:bifunctional enzyme CysN/CysC